MYEDKEVNKNVKNIVLSACFSDEDDVSGNQNNCYWPF
jgi:hypothetical protein